jgi:hypothetical protein
MTREQRWPRDLVIFGALAVLWSLVLLARVIFFLHAGNAPDAFQDVLFGVKFYGSEARVTMAIQAVVIGAFGVGILTQRRWGLVLALIYMIQVVAGHAIFIASNLGVESQRIHVRIASLESPVMVGLLVYLWLRSRSIVRSASDQLGYG